MWEDGNGWNKTYRNKNSTSLLSYIPYPSNTRGKMVMDGVKLTVTKIVLLTFFYPYPYYTWEEGG